MDSVEDLGEGVEARPLTTREGYARWAPFYDEPGNQLIDLEQPVVREILAGLPLGVALDAACGTGRHTAYLAALGHRVTGVDTSPEMLSRAREKVPDGEFYEADLHDVPLADDSVPRMRPTGEIRPRSSGTSSLPGIEHGRPRPSRRQAAD